MVLGQNCPCFLMLTSSSALVWSSISISAHSLTVGSHGPCRSPPRSIDRDPSMTDLRSESSSRSISMNQAGSRSEALPLFRSEVPVASSSGLLPYQRDLGFRKLRAHRTVPSSIQ